MNGIGGNTIQEAKRTMSMSEYLTWRSYILKRGTLNPARRIEREIGLLRFMTARVNGDKESELWDFAPHEFDRPDIDDQPPASLEDLNMLFSCHTPS